MINQKEIKNRLRQVMKYKGIKISDLANDLKITPANLYPYFSQNRELNLDKIVLFSEYLDVSLDYILLGKRIGLTILDPLAEKSFEKSLDFDSEHFGVYSQWDSIKGIKKLDLLIFKKCHDYKQNDIILIKDSSSKIEIGRYYDLDGISLLYYDNGLSPTKLENNHIVLGKLVCAITEY